MKDPTLGSSQLVPFRRGETTAARHQRRLEVAESMRDDFGRWVRSVGGTLFADSRPWRIVLAGFPIILWNPRIARLIVRRGDHVEHMHAHDVTQVESVVRVTWGLPKRAASRGVERPPATDAPIKRLAKRKRTSRATS